MRPLLLLWHLKLIIVNHLNVADIENPAGDIAHVFYFLLRDQATETKSYYESFTHFTLKLNALHLILA